MSRRPAVPSRRVARVARARGMTLVELASVLAVVGVMASLATPSLMEVARIYRAEEGARFVVSAFSQARGLAQQENAPIVVEIGERAITLSRGDYGPPPHGFLMTAQGFVVDRAIPFPDEVYLLNGGSLGVGSRIAFCPSGEYRFLDGTGAIAPGGAGSPLCGFGDLASTSGSLGFLSALKEFHLELRAPLAHLRVVAGATP